MLRLFPLTLIFLLTACGGKASQTAQPPAHAEPVAHESDLLKLTLTRQAEQRLGIATIRIGFGTARAMREASGEVVVPNGTGGVPTGALSNLAQIGASQAAADGEVERSRAQVRLAHIALDRARQLVVEEAGSVRARDEAAAALATAQAQANVAVRQRHLLGPSIASLGRQASLWVRVPVSGSDAADIMAQAAATVRALGSEQAVRLAQPIQAPPSANAIAGTVDLYYRIDNRGRAYRVGQRVAVALPIGKQQQGLSVPAGAVLRDIHGGEWVYERIAPQTYVRQRVEIASTHGDSLMLGRGLRAGAAIVTRGAMELFGTEFGVAH